LAVDLSSPSSGTATCFVAITAPTMPFLFVLNAEKFNYPTQFHTIKTNGVTKLLLDQNVDVTLQHFCLGMTRVGQLAHNVHDFTGVLKGHDLHLVQQTLRNLQNRNNFNLYLRLKLFSSFKEYDG
jgi:hypothetical protein